MFFDGIFYANVANNYANGFGTFWQMYYGNNISSAFNDQPPLAFFIQAQFYKILGNSIYVERFYDFLFAIIHLFIIRFLWQELTNKQSKLYWLPMLLWISIPLCSWTFKHNLMEVTMSAFDLAAVLFLYKGCKENKNSFLLTGSILILMASLSKGIQGLFPIMVPFFYWIVYRKVSFSSTVVRSMIVVSIPLATYIIFYLTPEINQSITLYFQKRLSGTFNHLQDTKTSHFYLLFKLLFELSAPAFLIFISWLIGRKAIGQYRINEKPLYLMALIGISASFPLMVTLEQRAFYLTTSLPYYVIAMAIISLPLATNILERLSQKKLILTNQIGIILIILASCLVLINAKNPKRDRDLLSDVYILKDHIPRGSSISITAGMQCQWAYQYYFLRYCYVQFDAQKLHPYFLLEGIDATMDCAEYTKLNLPLKKFAVFKKLD